MTADDIPEGFWDDLSPQDFIRDTSARHVAVLAHQPFHEFVERSVESLRFAYHAADGNPNPVAILVSTDGRRLYTPDDDESLGQYLDRLTREAKQYNATRVFTSWLTEGGAYDEGEQQEVGSQEALDALEASGKAQTVLYFFAQDGNMIRHGIIAVADGNTGEVFEAPGEHAAPVYRAILNG